MVDVDLVSDADLAGFPGVSSSPVAIRAAAQAVRDACGWHIAPVITETIEVETDGHRIAVLPSLRVVEVKSVTTLDGVAVTGWRLDRTAGVIKSGRALPEVINVTFTHGYEKCPPSLFPVIAHWAQQTQTGVVSRESIGARSVDYGGSAPIFLARVLGKYTRPGRP